MASIVPLFASLLGPFHILSYGILLGAQIYQTFIITKVAFIALPRPAFTTLQKRLFPIYFLSQSSLLLLTIASGLPLGSISPLGNASTCASLSIAGLTALLNLFVYGPRTRQAMIDRIHQVTRDKQKAAADPGQLSDEMRACNRNFSRAHAMSIHLNLITIIATVFYGFTLASRLHFD